MAKPSKIKVLPIYDRRIIQVMETVISNKVKNVSTKRDFLDSIGFHFRNFSQIKSGAQSFTSAQIREAGKQYNINYNFIFDEDCLEMFNKGQQASALSLLSQAVEAVKAELRKK